MEEEEEENDDLYSSPSLAWRVEWVEEVKFFLVESKKAEKFR